MLRITALSVIVMFLALYAWKDWFKSLCGLIVLMAVFEHPDMPKQLLGVPGLNLWNILFFSILPAWISNRKIERLHWDLPKNINWLLLLYLVVILIGFVRFISDTSGLAEYSSIRNLTPRSNPGYFFDYVINCVKWVIPALMLFDGCRSRARFNFAARSVLLMYFLLALLIIRAMGLSDLDSGDELQRKALKVLPSNVGYHRVNLAAMMAGTFWALYSYREMVRNAFARFALFGASAITFVATALTGGRMGYVTWGALAVIFCILRWRRLLLLAPVLVLGIVFFLPSVVDRMLFGFVENPDDPSTTQQYADYEDGQIRTLDVTSGRTLVWPLVIDKIKEGPVFGFGRDAMRNKGVSLHMATIVGSKGDVFSHPHNAYLQWILDNGVVGFSVVLLFYFLVVKYSLSLFLDSRSTTFIAAGGISAALVLGLLIASMGSQTFYPREGAVGMWCSIMLMFRIYLERAKWLGAGLIEEKSFDLFWDSNSQPTKRQRPAIS